MLEEIERDVTLDRLYLSSYLTQRAQGDWLDYLREAAQSGSDDTLAARLRTAAAMNQTTIRQKPRGGTTRVRVPHNAAEVLAESEFNRFYVRGLCHRAIEQDIPRLEVYRAKAVMQPRPESEQIIGLLVEPNTVLIDVRGSTGVETALGIPPGPGSGITLRIPR
ncbi:hypothetical protein MKK88_08750 [Methylobacterium sp. E-005]|uniref:hypothetical protein n=1 Tax=Methylobacterium sp. E-005 TaxID=2836549 RepID=UPI001FBBEFE8|nr:hypothetical protein [Methylobacterium sp. E-005]MCJ2086081.1 hypothetical protein [Methylobacterium sp. E-005]